jgi:hypothetical protein
MKFLGLAIFGVIFMLIEICVIENCNKKTAVESTTHTIVMKPQQVESKTEKVKLDTTYGYTLSMPKVKMPTPARASAPMMGPQIYNLPGYSYPGVSSLYSFPMVTQVIKDKNTEKKIESTEKKLKLSYSQNYGGNETKFEFELSNPSKEERVELYKVFIQQAREAQAAVKENYKIIQNEGGNIIVSNYNSR